MIPIEASSFRLMMEGSEAFTDMEQSGMRIDTEYLRSRDAWAEEKIAQIESELRLDPIGAEWRKLYGQNADFGKREQLAEIVFGKLGMKPKRVTKTGKYATDKDSFEGIDHPFVLKWTMLDDLKRVRAVNIRGILAETIDGFLHPSLNLHLAITYRSSCSDPNGQNIPNRDQRLAKIIRTAFIPRGPDFVLAEFDFSGIEVRAAACYHKDPTMIRYIEEDHDLHFDMASECYKIPPDLMAKPCRQAAKSYFVFAEFYGDWWPKVAGNLWRASETEGLKLKNDVLLRDHLSSVGLYELGNGNSKHPVPGSFEEHIKKVEDNFWNKRFPIYTEWKNEWWDAYLEKGWFQMKTGFVSRGIFGRNQVINSPIQGTAFHWLLWTVIELNKWLKKNKMLSRLIMQIHDSMILDLYRSEIQDVLNKVNELVTEGLRRHWGWINVPLAAEYSICEKNWYEKSEWVNRGGVWGPKYLAV